MSTTRRANALWQNGNNLVKLQLAVVIFAEDDIHYASCPALDILGYGYNDQEAEQSFKTMLDEFLNYTMHKKTFAKELERLGWKLESKRSKHMVPPDLTTMISTNDDLGRIMNTTSHRTQYQEIQLPA